MSERRPYNLLCKPWIPVVWRTDAAEPGEQQVGIRDALVRAHDIRCVSHTSPFIEFGIYRVLVTVVLDACIIAGKRPTIGKMEQMLEEGEFDLRLVSNYLNQYKDRFELFSGEHPFLQTTSASKEVDSISKMIAPVPSGTKIAFWHHFAGSEISLTEEEAARELCGVAPFCFDNAPEDVCTLGGDPPLYIAVLGDSLFQTIVYNLPRPSGRTTVRQESEAGPSWRCPVKSPAAVPRTPTLTQGWTWPVRQIRLDGDEAAERVSHAVNIAGAGKTAARERVRGWRDPNAGTITSAGRIQHIRATDLIPRFARGSRQGDQNPMMFWRDLVPLCLVGAEGEPVQGQRVRSRPEVVTNALRVSEDEALRLAVYGFIDKGGSSNKLFRTWFRSVLGFPTGVLTDTRLSARAIQAFKRTESVAGALNTALRMLRSAKGSREKRSERGEATTLNGFWHGLEPLLAREYLKDLAQQDSEAESHLREGIRKAAIAAFRQAAAPHRRTADGLFRVATASNWFERRLASLLPREGEAA